MNMAKKQYVLYFFSAFSLHINIYQKMAHVKYFCSIFTRFLCWTLARWIRNLVPGRAAPPQPPVRHAERSSRALERNGLLFT
ncbi:MAG TPA: hypothetical protein PLG50_09270, partial [bacterium]|nr:hypothetical protein [bacterium]